ncbi:hypothetical protein [Aliiglaciecola litoralis]|uniref:Uncharacterized protein n=1 Tax=Aliiglaciecola litoralis TaxID=582857 RepID=A0ABN1LEJ9_9ALTE
MTTFNKTLQMLLIAGSLFALTACEQSNTEEAGDAMEQMADDAGDAVDDAADSVDDAMTDAGNAVEDACENVKDGVDAEDTDC